MIGDVLRIVRWSGPDYEAARPVVVRDLLAGDVWIAEGGSPQLVPGEHDNGSIVFDHPYAGEVATTDRHRNARLTVGLRVLAVNPVAAANSLVAAAVNAPARSAVEWRRDGIGVATFFPLRNAASWTPEYSMRERMQGGGMLVNLDFEVAPYCHHGSMDIFDDFAVDSLADYTFDAGSEQLSVTGGMLVPTSTGVKALRPTARGHVYGDAQQTIKYVAGATVAGQVTALRAKWLGASDHLVGFVTGTATLGISKKNSGVLSSLTPTVSGIVAIVAGGTYWLRFRVEGNLLTAEHWSTEPTPMGAPTATATVTLAGADATKYGAGITGGVAIEVTPPGTDWRYVAYRVAAFTYRDRALPERLVLDGEIPGDLPALCDMHVTPSGGSSPPVFAAMGWWRRPSLAGVGARVHGILEAEAADVVTTWAPYSDARARGGSMLRAVTSAAGTLENLVPNPRPSNEGATVAPWTTVGDGVANNSGASMTAVGSGGQDGGSYWDVTTPGALGQEGPRIELAPPAGGWVAGNVYKVRLWLTRRVGSGSLYVFLAHNASAANSLIVAPTAGAWTLAELTFTATTAAPVSLTIATIGLQVNATFSVSQTHVSKVADTGTALPAYFDGQSAGYMWEAVPYNSKTIRLYTARAEWPVDGLSFDGRDGLVDTEVFAWMVLDQAALTNLRVVLASIPVDGTDYGATRYSEYGSDGYAPVLLGGLQWRLVRLGRIALPAEVSERARLVVTANWGIAAAGEIGLDYLMCLPADVLAASPMNVAVNASYPRFAPSTQQMTRLSHADGSASIVKPGGRVMPEHGLGRRIELPVGRVDALIALSSRVPGDPTGAVPTLQTTHRATVHAAVLPRYLYS